MEDDVELEATLQGMSLADLRSADAAYLPISPFAAWATLAVDDGLWTAYRERLQHEREKADGSVFDSAVDQTMRLAAFDDVDWDRPTEKSPPLG